MGAFDFANKKLLLVSTVWPECESSAAGVRDEQLVSVFESAGFEIVLASPSSVNEASASFASRGIRIETIAANDSSFDSFLRELSPDVVVFDRFIMEEQFGWRVRAVCPEALRIVDSQDLHSLRRAREQSVKSGKTFQLEGEDFYREIASFLRSDGTYLLSDFELKLLCEEYRLPRELFCLSRFTYPEREKSGFREFGEREGFLFVGNFRHAPNLDAVKWLFREIWPLVRKRLPQAVLTVCGAYPLKEIEPFHRPDLGFLLKGHVKDLEGLMSKVRVNLAPLRFGAGIKGKIAQGFSLGLPCVSTGIGAEGLLGARAVFEESVNLKQFLFGGGVAEGVDEFVDRACALYENEALWNVARDAGLLIARENFNQEKESVALLEDLRARMREREKRRRKNFLGEMLWSQGLRSTTYFSRWIELKNQK